MSLCKKATHERYENCLTNISTIVWIPELEQSTLAATDQHWHDGRAQDSQGVDVIALRVGTIHSLGQDKTIHIITSTSRLNF
jgi:hypothetical protein